MWFGLGTIVMFLQHPRVADANLFEKIKYSGGGAACLKRVRVC